MSDRTEEQQRRASRSAVARQSPVGAQPSRVDGESVPACLRAHEGHLAHHAVNHLTQFALGLEHLSPTSRSGERTVQRGATLDWRSPARSRDATASTSSLWVHSPRIAAHLFERRLARFEPIAESATHQCTVSRVQRHSLTAKVGLSAAAAQQQRSNHSRQRLAASTTRYYTWQQADRGRPRPPPISGAPGTPALGTRPPKYMRR